jgi:hypothetical protein
MFYVHLITPGFPDFINFMELYCFHVPFDAGPLQGYIIQRAKRM